MHFLFNEIINLPQSSLTVNMCTDRQRKAASPLLVPPVVSIFKIEEGCAVFDFLSLGCGVCICNTSVNRRQLDLSTALVDHCSSPGPVLVLGTKSLTLTPILPFSSRPFQALLHPVIHKTHLFQPL